MDSISVERGRQRWNTSDGGAASPRESGGLGSGPEMAEKFGGAACAPVSII